MGDLAMTLKPKQIPRGSVIWKARRRALGEVASRYHYGEIHGIYVECLEYEVTSMQPILTLPLKTCKKAGHQYVGAMREITPPGEEFGYMQKKVGNQFMMGRENTP